MRIFPELTIRGIGFAILRIAVLTYVFYGLIIYARQEQMLYFPDQTPFPNCAELASVTQVDMNGTRGYFFQNATSTKLAVLYHGNAGRACERAFYRTAFEHAGYSWLFVEYAGYAGDVDANGNMKTPSTKMILQDVRNVHEWIQSRQNDTLAIIGESIGSGPASFHASLAQPDTLILISSFARLSSLAQEFYPFFPVRYMLRHDYNNVAWAKSAKRVLVIHGDADTIVSIAHGKDLFVQLPQIDKEFITLSGVDHNESFGVFETQYALFQFLKNGTLTIDLDK